jgi:hypothetical protein
MISDYAAWCVQPHYAAGSQAPWQGLRHQTPIYMRGLEVRRAVFLAIRDSDTPAARKRWETLQGEAAAVQATTGLGIEAERIDMLPKRSATKAWTAASRGRTRRRQPGGTSMSALGRDRGSTARSAAVWARQRPARGFGHPRGVRPACGPSTRRRPLGRGS